MPGDVPGEERSGEGLDRKTRELRVCRVPELVYARTRVERLGVFSVWGPSASPTCDRSEWGLGWAVG